MTAHSQTTPNSTKANLEKAKANPNIKEQQAKADVHVVKKSLVIADTTSSTKTNLEKVKANPVTKKQQAKADVHVVKKSPHDNLKH